MNALGSAMPVRPGCQHGCPHDVACAACTAIWREYLREKAETQAREQRIREREVRT